MYGKEERSSAAHPFRDCGPGRLDYNGDATQYQVPSDRTKYPAMDRLYAVAYDPLTGRYRVQRSRGGARFQLRGRSVLSYLWARTQGDWWRGSLEALGTICTLSLPHWQVGEDGERETVWGIEGELEIQREGDRTEDFLAIWKNIL